MLLIRNAAASKSGFSADQDQAFLKACEVYIENLKKNGNLQRAQPLIREGTMISGSGGKWNQQAYNEGKDVIVGYYHILAKDMDEAIAIAKGNPEFEYTTTAVGSSRVDLQACKLEYSIVSPK